MISTGRIIETRRIIETGNMTETGRSKELERSIDITKSLGSDKLILGGRGSEKKVLLLVEEIDSFSCDLQTLGMVLVSNTNSTVDFSCMATIE